MGLQAIWNVAVNEFFEYDTPKMVHIKSRSVGAFNRLVQFVLIVYIFGYAILYKKGYQEVDDVEGVITTKVKGTTFTNLSGEEPAVPDSYRELYHRIWDPADYVIPASGGDLGGFFIITNVIITPNQTRSQCPEDPTIYGGTCDVDANCTFGKTLLIGNGAMTGNCVESRKPGIKTCEVFAWCPVEIDEPPLFNGTKGLLEKSKTFTVLIKNAIKFPKFGPKYERSNILQNATKRYLQSCNYHPSDDPYCPIFRLGDIVKHSGYDYDKIAVTGGVFQVTIEWDCNLDFDFMENCRPHYSFQRMDDPNTKISTGWNFRKADYYSPNTRTLYKNFGIKFLVSVQGQAGKFNIVPLTVNFGSGVGLLGVATVLCDILIFHFTKDKQHYKNYKKEIVTKPEAHENENNACKQDTTEI